MSSTAAAGTINHATLGGFSLATKSSSDVAPMAPSFAESLTLSSVLVKDNALMAAA